MIGKECEEQGIPFIPEDDWSMPERLAEDEVRAKEKAALRKQAHPEPATKRRLQYGQWAEEEMADWNKKKASAVQLWGEAKYIEWNTRCGEVKEADAEREERRSRNSRGN